MTRPVFQLPVLQGALTFLLWILAAGVAVAAEQGDACGLLEQTGEQEKIPYEYRRSVRIDGQRRFLQGMKVQQGLASVFSGNLEFEKVDQKEPAKLHDGRIGPVTRTWLRQFCLDYPVHGASAEVPVAVMESILHYDEIAARHPDWKDILGSLAFDEWLHSPSADELLETRLIRRSGAASVVNRLLDEYSAIQSGETPSETEALACESLLESIVPAADPRFNLRATRIARQVQIGLQAVFTGDPEYDQESHENDLLLDGKVGSHTRKWLARFCETFPVSASKTRLQDQVVKSVLQYADIAAVHPDWREVLGAEAFNQWILDDVPVVDRRQFRLSGSAPIVNQLLAQFKAQQATGTVERDRGECPSDRAAAGTTYYRLTGQDWDQLQGRQAFIGQVDALVGERFDSEEALDEAVGLSTYDGGDACVRQGFFDALHTASPKPGSTYRLTEASLLSLRDQLTKPEHTSDVVDVRFVAGVLSALAELQDQDFGSKAELAQFVRFKAQFAWEDALAAAPAPGAPEVSFEADEVDATRAEAEAEPATSTDDSSARVPAPPGGLTIADGVNTQSEGAKDERGEPEQPAETQSEGAKVPETGEAKEGKAHKEDASGKINALVGQVVAVAEKKLWPFSITEDAVEGLKKDAGFVDFPEDDLERLTALLDVAYASDALYATAVQDALKTDPGSATATGAGVEPGAAASVEEVQAIVRQALKTYDADDSLDVKAAGDCGCARRWDKVGTNQFVVYGFYPSWLNAPVSPVNAPTTEDPSAVQDDGNGEDGQAGGVDFGIYDRVAYYSVKLDDKGTVVKPTQWSGKGGADKMVRTAHRYLSEVDLVIELPYWQKLTDKVIEQAVDQIATLVDPDAQGVADSGKQGVSVGVKPDGVTLYFPGFDYSSPATHRKIVDLVTRLHERLNPDDGEATGGTLLGSLARSLGMDGGDRPFAVNILIDADRLELGASSTGNENGRLLDNLEYLGKLKEILVGDRQKVDLVLVMLGRPVTDLKKKLRLAVENEFQGEERIDVLRKIVPVIPPNGHLEAGKADVEAEWGSEEDPYRQLQHDLVYFRDNFRGVAFWPAIPGTTGEESQVQSAVLKERLVGVFSQSGNQRGGNTVSALLGQDPCVYVCPNRWYLIILFVVLLGILVPVATLAYWSCRLRSFIARNTLPVLALVGLLVLMFAAFIACIPALNDHQDSILGGLLVLLIAIAIFYYIRKVRQGPLP